MFSKDVRMATAIRAMTPEDKPAIMRVVRATPEFLPSEVVVAEEVIDSYLRDPSGSGYNAAVADVDGSPGGYICYGRAPMTESTWDLYWAAVDRKRRGRGIGKALFAYAEARIEEAGGTLAIIETSSKPDYERTRRFHLSRGYEVACRVADYYAPGDDKLILTKRLGK